MHESAGQMYAYAYMCIRYLKPCIPGLLPPQHCALPPLQPHDSLDPGLRHHPQLAKCGCAWSQLLGQVRQHQALLTRRHACSAVRGGAGVGYSPRQRMCEMVFEAEFGKLYTN